MFLNSDDTAEAAVQETPPEPLAPARARSGVSVIAAGVSVAGDLDGECEIQVDGTIEGNVRCTTVIVGEHGSVKGEIKADTVTVGGLFEGKINARTVTLIRTARVDGALVVSEGLAIEAGADFVGRCERPAASDASRKGDGADFDKVRKELAAMSGRKNGKRKSASSELKRAANG